MQRVRKFGLSASNAQQKIDYGYDAVYQLTSEVVNVSGTVTTNGWRYDSAGNLREIVQGTQHTLLAVNSDNELVGMGDTSSTQTALVDRIEAVGQVASSNKWYNSWASAKGQSAQVTTQDGGFVISNVAVSAGANALTVTVQDVSSHLATQIVNFTVGSVTNRNQFMYDANGNLAAVSSQQSAISYGYDAENRLTTVISNGVAVLQCWYDGSGHRIAKREIISGQTNTVQYVWDGWNLIAVLGADGQLQEYYTRGVGIAGDIGSLVAVTSYVNGTPSATRHLHNNHRGDVIMARQGVTVARLDYTPYGQLRSQIGTYTPRFLFSSKEYDASTGLYHFPYRYYAPMWARWVNRDPLENVELREGPNLYEYVRNQPILRTDPSGLGAYCGSGWLSKWLRDDPNGFDFSDCCKKHDAGYDKCGKPKAETDEEFYECMTQVCEEKYNNKVHCIFTANLYRTGVVDHGQSAYDNAQKCACGKAKK